VFLLPRSLPLYGKQENGGCIINMGSSSTCVASGPGHSPYRASKHGMLGFSKNDPLEGKGQENRRHSAQSSHVKTPMTEIIDKGLYDGDLPAYTDGWLDEKELEGRHSRFVHRRRQRRLAGALCGDTLS
jgi:NAD(P)-dependent dehydrogenase (short-subunit alcohol dehydrogenase family)